MMSKSRLIRLSYRLNNFKHDFTRTRKPNRA